MNRFLAWIEKLNHLLTTFAFLAVLGVLFISYWGYGASPLYYFKQLAVADQELDRKQRQFEMESQLSDQFNELGNRFLNLGKYEDAAQAFQESLTLNKYNAHAQFGLFKAKLLQPSQAKQADLSVIRQRIELLLKHHPDDPHGLVARALWNYNLGQSQVAETMFRQVVSRHPEVSEALYGLATLKIRKPDYPEAISLLEQATEQAPFEARYWNNLAYAYYQNEQYAQATQAYGKTRLLDGDYALPWLEEAQVVLLDKENVERSQVLVKQFLKLMSDEKVSRLPKNQAAYLVVTTQGTIRLSTQDMKRSLAHRFLALLHFLNNQPDLSQQALHQSFCLSLDPAESSRVNDALKHYEAKLVKSYPNVEPFLQDFDAAIQYWTINGCSAEH